MFAKTVPVLLVLFSISLSSAAPLTLAVDKYCGIVDGNNRFNIGSDAGKLRKLFGFPDNEGLSPDGKYNNLEYPGDGLTVQYNVSNNRISAYMIDLEKAPNSKIYQGPKFTDSLRLLSRKLGNPTASGEGFYHFYTSGCKITLTKQGAAGKPLYIFVDDGK